MRRGDGFLRPTTSPVYDANGSRILQQASSGVPATFTWDAANRLSSIWQAENIGIGPAIGYIISQTYRPDDMRLSESVNGGITTMVWSNNDVLGVIGPPAAPYPGSHQLQQVFVNTPGVSDSVSDSGGGGGMLPLSPSPTPSLVRAMGIASDVDPLDYSYHTDMLGTTLATSGNNSSTNENYHTDSWGNVLNDGAFFNPYVYLGGLGGSGGSRSGSLRSAACV